MKALQVLKTVPQLSWEWGAWESFSSRKAVFILDECPYHGYRNKPQLGPSFFLPQEVQYLSCRSPGSAAFEGGNAVG